MINKSSARMAALACAGLASLGLTAMPGTAVAKMRAAQFSQCMSTALAIPDGPASGTAELNPVASFAIPVRVPRFKGKPQSGVVTRINSVGVRISHSDDGDLALFLVSPGGRAIALATYRDQSSNKDPDTGEPSPSGDGYGSGAQGCSGSLVQFGDSFAPSIATPGNSGLDTPITGAFTPEQPLGTFVGGPARGFWTLIVQDVQNRDTGQLDALSLSFDYRYKAKTKRKRR